MSEERNTYSRALRYRGFLDAEVYVELMNTRKKMPSLEIGNDNCAYTDHKTIHLGTGMIENGTDKELFDQLFFLLGHEMQHIQSTTDKDWKAAIKSAERNICNKLAKDVLKKPVRLVRDTDFEKFYEELCTAGVIMNRRQILEFIHFVLNALEDGRIENIRSKKHPGFKRYRKIFRGKMWQKNVIPDDSVKYKDLTSGQHLVLLLDEILTIATMEVHSKGFLKVYGDTKAVKEIAEFIPYIKTAVFSRTCRKCMDQGIEIIDKLTDLIIETAKADEFEKTLLSIISKMIEDLEKSEFNPSPSEEEEGDEESEDSSDAEDAVFGVSVLRDKPKDKKSDKSDKSDKAEKSKKSGKSDGEGDESGSGSGDQEGSGDGKGEGEKGDGEQTDGENIGSDSFDGDPSGSTAHTNEGSDADIDDPEEIIRKAMEEAEEAADPNMDAAEEDAEKERKFKETMDSWKSSSDSAPIDTSGFDDDYEDVKFNENRRVYIPDIMLPFELENKGKSLKNKIKEVLKNKRLPDARGLKSGSMDGRLIHRLIFSDTKVFKKRGEEEVPDIAGYILLDNSGSMGQGPGSNRHFACDAVSIIEEGFKDFMPLKIAAFDAMCSSEVCHEVIKDFDENAPANFTHNFLVQGRTGWGNKDGYDIRIATEELARRNEKEKLLVVTSDGIPTDYMGGYDEGVKDVRKQVERARSLGIKVIGLYMYSSQSEEEFEMFKRMYEPEYIICERSEMEEELVRVMKNAFFS